MVILGAGMNPELEPVVRYALGLYVFHNVDLDVRNIQILLYNYQ